MMARTGLSHEVLEHDKKPRGGLSDEVLEHDAVGRGEEGEDVLDEVPFVIRERLPVLEVARQVHLLSCPERCLSLFYFFRVFVFV